MTKGVLTIVGLGPGASEHLSLETLKALADAPVVRLRTAVHPAVAELDRRGIRYETFDECYEEGATFEAVYRRIADACLALAQTTDLVYAVPGSPLVAEETVRLLRKLAPEAGVELNICPAMSFLDVLYTKAEIDPGEGLVVADALRPETYAGLRLPIIITQVYSRHVASEVKLTLMDVFPDDWPVKLLLRLGLPDETVRVIPLYELDRQQDIDHLSTLYVPPLTKETTTFDLQPLQEVLATLRSPGGCPWDVLQTHSSLRRYLLEEVYEALEAIDDEDAEGLCEELGDVLLQVVFHARIAEESGAFTMQDVIDTVVEKMIRRHPHVFGDIQVEDAAEVVVNWEAIKKREKAGSRKRVLDGISKGLPSLLRANKLQAKTAKVGFDWANIEPVWGKVDEELAELRQALAGEDRTRQEEEGGDVLFAIVNLLRWAGIEPETALHGTNDRFAKRFEHVEDCVLKSGRPWKTFSLEELDCFWNEAKQLEHTS